MTRRRVAAGRMGPRWTTLNCEGMTILAEGDGKVHYANALYHGGVPPQGWLGARLAMRLCFDKLIRDLGTHPWRSS